MTPPMADYTLNIRGRLLSLQTPLVMGIVNVTPDSFYAPSRVQGAEAVVRRVGEVLAEGGSLVDVGACSTRPGSASVDEREEMSRLRPALSAIRGAFPDVVLSIDTFRASVAKMCVEEYGADIINDISGGDLDPAMFATVAHLGVPYVLMHTRATPADMQRHTDYTHLLPEILCHLAERIQRLRSLGQKDIIIDPGFGFAKTLQQNYELLAQLPLLRLLELPILIGVSRKSMVQQVLGVSADEALCGTTVLHAICLRQGTADILRVHDVKPAVEAVRIWQAVQPYVQDHD